LLPLTARVSKRGVEGGYRSPDWAYRFALLAVQLTTITVGVADKRVQLAAHLLDHIAGHNNFFAHGFTSFGPEHSPAHILAQRSSTIHLG
jgi:hypothetical protein